MSLSNFLGKLFSSSAGKPADQPNAPSQKVVITDQFRQQAKAASEAKVLALDGRVCDWLPVLDDPALRPLEEVKGRMSVLNALVNISFEAPVAIIRNWLTEQNLLMHLSVEEVGILNKADDQLTEQELTNLRWSLESLWAMMWATGMVPELNPVQWCGDNMAALLPNLEQKQGNEKLSKLQTLRPVTELYQMLDYYYRLHWYCVDERLNNRTATVSESSIYERRKALQWIYNAHTDWDDMEMGT